MNLINLLSNIRKDYIDVFEDGQKSPTLKKLKKKKKKHKSK